MKLNITVEVDWIDEDGDIDEVVQNQIIQGVKDSISRDCLKMVEQKTQNAINDGMVEAIKSLDRKVSAFFDNWLSKEVVITDKYGDKKESGSLESIIKRRLNDCMNERVNEKGEVTNYGDRYSRLEYVSGRKVKEVVDSYMKSFNSDIDKTVKSHIEAGIKQRVSDKFAEMVIGYAAEDHKKLTAIQQNGN